MHIPYDPDRHVAEPIEGSGGTGFVLRTATPEEYRAKRLERLTAMEAELAERLRKVRAELVHARRA